MTIAEIALRSFARARGSHVRRCNIFDANVGETAYLETHFAIPEARIQCLASASRITFSLRFSDRAFAFSVNKPNELHAFRHRFDVSSVRHPIYVSDERMAITVRPWLVTSNISGELAKLSLRAPESLHVSINGLTFVCDPARELKDLPERLIAIFHRIPAAMPEPTDVADLPDDLRSLALFFERWAISDDDQRSERVEQAAKDELRRLRRAVEPLLPRIDAYLTSLSEPYPDSALELGYLAELVAELRAHEA